MGSKMLRSGRFALVLVSCCLVTAAARADEAGVLRAAVARADSFLGAEARGSAVLDYLHMGARYRGHKLEKVVGVNDENGNPVPGEFALVYRFNWSDDGITDVAFLCGSKGDVFGLEVKYTNAVLSRPFVLASVSARALGAVLLRTLGDDLSEDHRASLQRLVDAADAQGMLTWLLQLAQSLR